MQLINEGVDDHQRDEHDEHPQRPQAGFGPLAEQRAWYGSGGLDDKLVALEVHDQLVLQAPLRNQILCLERAGLMWMAHALCRPL